MLGTIKNILHATMSQASSVCVEQENRGLMGGGVYKHEQVIVIVMKLKSETRLGIFISGTFLLFSLENPKVGLHCFYGK